MIASRYTGVFRSLRAMPVRAYDPDVCVWSGVPANRPWPARDAVGGAGWTDAEAERACLGEAVERWHTHAQPGDRTVRAAFAAWDRDGAPGEAALDPRRFVRFSDEQHALPGFAFARLAAETEVEWVACRALGTGEPLWVPAELVVMDLRPTAPPSRFGPAISTGWAAHATLAAATEAAVREVIERDAVVGAWWGHYAIVELAEPTVRAQIGDAKWSRLARPNLRWRWYRVISPYSDHVTLATVAGEDTAGFVFAVGSACRLDRTASLEKAALEAVQGRHYVRYLLATGVGAGGGAPTSFAEHAVYYSRHAAHLADTCLASAARDRDERAPPQTPRDLLAAIGPVAMRRATPPALAHTGIEVVRVIAPELQPLHGHHGLPFLGGRAWGRPMAEYAAIPPHPFA